MPPKDCCIGLLFAASLILLIVYWCILTNEWKAVTVSVPIITIPFQKKIGNGQKQENVPTVESMSPSDGGYIHSSVQTTDSEVNIESDGVTTHHSGVSTTTVYQSNQVTSRHMTNADIHSDVMVKRSTPPLRYNTTAEVTAEMVDATQSTYHKSPHVIVIPKSNRSRSSVAGPDYPAADLSTAERPITKTKQQKLQPVNGQRPPPDNRANQQRPQLANVANQQRPPRTANQQRPQLANVANQQRPPSTANQQRPQLANVANQQRPQLANVANQQRPPSTANQQRYAPQGAAGKRLNQLATTYRSQHQPLSGCREPYCLDYLGDKERWVYKTCLEKTRGKKPPDYDLSCPCQFMNGDGKPVVALVSLPGSGNTWVRGLLQKATGVCTGSIYCDRTLRAEGFCGEGLRSSALLSIKTHDTALQWKGVKYKNVNPNRPFFDAAIFIIRDPFRAAISEWNRKTSGQFSMNQNGSNHVKYVDTPKLFGDNPVWDNYARYHARKWRMMISSYIIKRRQQSVLVVRYEDIKTDTLGEVKRMLDFLKYPYSDAELRGKLEEDFTTFYRNHSYSFDHFTASQKDYFNDIVAGVAKSVSSNIGDKLNEYVRL